MLKNMKACAIRDSFQECSPEIARLGFWPESKTHILKGKEYVVFALVVFKGVTFFQILNEFGKIAWLPAWLFEMTIQDMPGDWICSYFADQVQLVIGPEFVAKDQETYRSMVELEPEEVQAFWKRFDALGYKREFEA